MSRKKRNILHIIKRRKANWTGHNLRRNCLTKHIIQGTIEVGIQVTRRQGRRRKQHTDDPKKTESTGN